MSTSPVRQPHIFTGSASSILPPSSSRIPTALVNRFLKAWGRFSPTSRVAPFRSKWRMCPIAYSVRMSPDNSYTTASDVLNADSPIKRNSPYKETSFVFHPLKVRRTSIDEDMFCLTVKSLGPEAAIYFAAAFRWKCERPLRTLRGMMNERQDRRYTKRRHDSTSL